MEEGVYESFVEVPFFEQRYTEMGRTIIVNLLYSMTGVMREGGILLHFPTEEGYALLRMDSRGYGQRRGLITINPDELRFNIFHLSSEGILCALLADDWRIKVAWWRLDRFLVN